MEETYMWEEALQTCCPLINYAIISGASVDEITNILQQMENEDKLNINSTIKSNQLHPVILSRLPNVDRK